MLKEEKLIRIIITTVNYPTYPASDTLKSTSHQSHASSSMILTLTLK